MGLWQVLPLLSNRNRSLWPPTEVTSARSPAHSPQRLRVTLSTTSTLSAWHSRDSHVHPSLCSSTHPGPGSSGLTLHSFIHSFIRLLLTFPGGRCSMSTSGLTFPPSAFELPLALMGHNSKATGKRALLWHVSEQNRLKAKASSGKFSERRASVAGTRPVWTPWRVPLVIMTLLETIFF